MQDVDLVNRHHDAQQNGDMAHTMIISISVKPRCCLLLDVFIIALQSLYFWSFKAVPGDFVYTSNTFCPPRNLIADHPA